MEILPEYRAGNEEVQKPIRSPSVDRCIDIVE